MRNDDAYDVIKTVMLHRTLCDVVWRRKDKHLNWDVKHQHKQTKTKTGPHGNTDGNLLYMTIYISFVMQSVSFLVLYQTFPYIGSSGSQYDIHKTDFHLKCLK